MHEAKGYDFLVVGAGVAGLRAAIELGRHGAVLCLAKREISESNTRYAQGGIAAVVSEDDEIGLHLQDTLTAGAGLCDESAVAALVEEAPERIEELIGWGAQFDRKDGKLSLGREGAHSRNRILHAQGDATGREIGRALYAHAKKIKNIHFREFGAATDLIAEDETVVGVRMLNDDGSTEELRAPAVLLACGGLGAIYANTTNPSVATGDGMAMAWRAGAELRDMEFVQFHPTALYLPDAPRFLLSEALRGEGAKLRNAELARFMPKHHPLAELAPRDVVARAIVHELEISRLKDPVVYLDLTELNAARIRQRFPTIYKTCLAYNIDITEEMIPIRPAAHYMMGGVRTDMEGRTSLEGLYAAGEVASTGVHGANRLASNSLLEGLVYGYRAAETMAMEHPPEAAGRPCKPRESAPCEAARDAATEAMFVEAQQTLWRCCGVVRDAKGLQAALDRLRELSAQAPAPQTRRQWETRNALELGAIIARSALARQESRGAHYRTDHAALDDKRYKKHSIALGEAPIRFE